MDELGLTGRVRFHEDVPNAEIVRFFHAASIFVLPSRQEGLGIVVLEAMACGLPVVATRCGGPEDVVVDGATGFLVENDDADAFAAAISRLLRDPSLGEEMGRNAAKRIHEHYACEEIAARFREAYLTAFPGLRSGR
jgi:glycosyltransferase involved in cell wall biosynthesis